MKPLVVFLLAMISCLLWGSAFPMIKLGYAAFDIAAGDSATQILFAGVRFLLAGTLVILIGSLVEKKVLHPTGCNAGKIIVLSLFQTILQYLFFYIGLAHTTGVKASIIEGSNVFIAILISVVVFRFEKLTARSLLGSILGFFGVFLINIEGTALDFNFAMLGEGFILLSTVAYALSSTFIKKYAKDENPVMLSGYQFAVGGLVMIFIGVLAGGENIFTEITVKEVMLLIYLAMVSAVAYSIWSILLKHNPVSKVAVYGFMNPVFGVILSNLLLKEDSRTFGWITVTSLMLVSVGMLLTVSKKNEVVIVHEE